jgi:hypothetical protein
MRQNSAVGAMENHFIKMLEIYFIAVPHEISFLVLSQQTEFHRGMAQQLKKSIIEQALKMGNHEQENVSTYVGKGEKFERETNDMLNVLREILHIMSAEVKIFNFLSAEGVRGECVPDK